MYGESDTGDLRFPTSIIALLAAALLLFVGWISWISYSGYRDLKSSSAYLVDLEYSRSRIVELGEVLTMSARMAAATGDPKWIERHA